MAAQKMTADEFQVFATREGRYELIRGEVRALSPTGFDHGRISARIAYYLLSFVETRSAGEVLGAETGFRFQEQGEATVRAPDVAFIRADRARVEDPAKFVPLAPDLVAEVLSPSDTMDEVLEKVQWWLSKGVRIVWVVDPKTRTVTAYHPNGDAHVYQHGDTLGGGDVLPGFALPLDQLFR